MQLADFLDNGYVMLNRLLDSANQGRVPQLATAEMSQRTGAGRRHPPAGHGDDSHTDDMIAKTSRLTKAVI